MAIVAAGCLSIAGEFKNSYKLSHSFAQGMWQKISAKLIEELLAQDPTINT